MTGSIVGRVLSKSGSPLSGVKVSCEGGDTLTLPDGTYRLEHLEPKIYVVEVAIQGFETQRKKVAVKDEEGVVADFHMNDAVGTGVIHGHVLDKLRGKPISHGTVTLILPLINKYASVNSEGHYEFRNLAPGEYKLYFSTQHYEEEMMTTTLRDGEVKILNISCRPSNRVEPPWG
ncbi:carboxypeptidase regulatory-like domain-containing protein [Candidatus Bathyarchaeota archaeon]|nr:carboxypeptidase regulatory-like domain-containing protein [Candidatus Bathyarchaeota archaeon]